MNKKEKLLKIWERMDVEIECRKALENFLEENEKINQDVCINLDKDFCLEVSFDEKIKITGIPAEVFNDDEIDFSIDDWCYSFCKDEFQTHELENSGILEDWLDKYDDDLFFIEEDDEE